MGLGVAVLFRLPACSAPPANPAPAPAAPAPPAASQLPVGEIKLPPGFRLSVYTDQTPNARGMCLSPSGTLFVGSRNAGAVYAVRD